MTFNSEQIDEMEIWGRSFPIRIVADLFDGEEINQNQQDAYTLFMQNKDNILAEAYATLKTYCTDSYPDKINEENFNIFSYIIPKSLYIKRTKSTDRIVGLFCKFRYDKENDLVVCVLNERVEKIGTQDIIL